MSGAFLLPKQSAASILAAMKTISKTPKYDNKRLSLEEHVVAFDNGNTGIFPIIRFPANGGAMVAIVRAGKVLLLREYKYAVGEEIITLPAGYMDEGETPEQAAHREVKEEIGREGLTLHGLGKIHPIPANSQVANHLFIAFGGHAGEATPEDGEQNLKQEWVPLAEAEAMALDGRITHAPAVVTLLKAAHYMRIHA